MRKLAALFPKPSATGWIAIAVTVLVVVAVVAMLLFTGGAKPLLKVAAGTISATTGPTPQTGLPYSPAPSATATPGEGGSGSDGGTGGTPPSGVDAKGQIVSGVVPGQEQIQPADTNNADGKSGNHKVDGTTWSNPTQPGAPDAPKVLPGALESGAHPSQVAFNQAPPAGGGTAGQQAVLTTPKYVGRFGPEVATARGAGSVNASQNACLDAWVIAHVHDYDGRSVLGTQSLCGLTVAVVGGAAGIDDTTFIGMGKAGLNAGVTSVLIGARNSSMVFAAARTGSGTDDRGTVLMVAANT